MSTGPVSTGNWPAARYNASFSQLGEVVQGTRRVGAAVCGQANAPSQRPMYLLTQFIYRISFGLAAAMAITSPRDVTSGYYRNHSYVLLGLNVFSALVAHSSALDIPAWPAVLVAALSYVSAVMWLYEKPRAGVILLVATSAASLVGSWFSLIRPEQDSPAAYLLSLFDPLTSGLVLGITIGAMFLGHWYLNSPGMVLRPLQRLVQGMALAVAARMLVCGAGAWMTLALPTGGGADFWLFLVLRWLTGLCGAAGIAWMADQTLRVPNTQAATGLLYVGVIVTFVGELAGLLMSLGTPYPL